MKLRIFFSVFLFLSFFMLAGQEVGQVVFKQDGSFLYSEDLLRSNVQTKKGLVFSEQVVNEDVRRLVALGIFADVVSVIEDMPDGKKSVTFRTVAKPVVTEVVFEGNKKFSEKDLREHVHLYPGAPLKDAELAAAAENLRKFYIEKGYNSARIDPVQTPDGGGVKITFRIEENLRVRVNDVSFEGTSVYKPSELRDALETRYSCLSAAWLSWLPLSGGYGLLNPEALERDRVRLRELYWRKGYLDFKIKEIRTQALPSDPEKADVVFVIEEGEPYFVGNVTVDGNTRFTEEEIGALQTMREDEVYNSQKDDAFMHAVESRYMPLGYADFAIRCERIPNYETHTVDLHYILREGPPYTIGEVYISGNKWTKDKVIRREILLYPDEPLDQSLIDITKNRLVGMGYFEGKGKDQGVEIVAVNSPEPNKKDIHINVKEKRFIDGKIGAGWSSDDSLAGMIEVTHSNFDILDPKNYFTGGGQRLRLMGIVGLEHMGFEANFTEPWLFDIPLRLDISSYWREVKYEDWRERRIGFNIGLTKRIFDDFTTISGGYTFEYVKVYHMDKKLSERFQKEEGWDLVGRIHLTLERDTRDSATDPTSGYFVSGTAAVTTQGLGATNNYYKFEMRGIHYFPFLRNLFVFSLGFKVGSMGTFDSSKDVPLYDRYFLGGGDSVRGFPYRSIGPTDRNDDNYGGQFMYVVTAELTHPIWQEYGLRGAFFCDVGDATSGTCGPISTPNVGVGWGLRIKLPHVAMPIRLDLGYPIVINQPNVSRKLRFHFNMGFSF